MGQTLVAVDPEALQKLTEEVAALRAAIRSVHMSPAPEWVPVNDYAKTAGVTRRTVMNWIERGQIDSRRHGAKVMVRANPAA